MKNIVFVFLTILTTQALAQVSDAGIEDLEHKNKGCPINSLCSKANGQLATEWEAILETMHIKKKQKKMDAFYKKNGIPTRFLAKKSIQETKDVILMGSRCKHHNPKNPYRKIYKGIKFTRSLPISQDYIYDQIHVFEDEKKITTYKTSYESRPIFIKEDRLFFLEDFNEYIYQSSMDKKGNIKLENLPQKLFSQAQAKKISEVPCPKNKKEKSDLYTSSYCQKIWDIDTNSLKTIQIYWSCP